jgi:hypothetical protein
VLDGDIERRGGIERVRNKRREVNSDMEKDRDGGRMKKREREEERDS